MQILLLPILLAGLTFSQTVHSQEMNILLNGGLENWESYTPSENPPRSRPVVEDSLIPQGTWVNASPLGFAEQPDMTIGTTFARDASVKHGGEYAARITQTEKDIEESTSLRGFGALQVTVRYYGDNKKKASLTTFRAEDHDHAKIVASKRMTDILAFGDFKPTTLAGISGTAIILDGAGWWLLGVEGKCFFELFAHTKSELRVLAERIGTNNWRKIPEGAYPRWLDNFDNAGTAVWWGGGGQPVDIPGDFEWAKEHRFALKAKPPSYTRFVQPGLLDTSITDWFSAMAKRYDIPYRTYLWPYPTASIWNREPLPYVQHADKLKVAWPRFWVNHVASGFFGASGGTEPVPVLDPYLQDFRRRFAEGLNDDPNFLAHFAVSEMASAGVLDLAVVAGMPETKLLWHEYLQDILGLDLQQVGLRYQGQEDAYTSWEEVQVPCPEDFVGFNSDCLDLTGVWEGHADHEKAGTAAQWYLAGSSPKSGWQPVDCNDPMLLLYDGGRTRHLNKREKIPDYWLRRSFIVSAGQAKNLRYLHISRSKMYSSTVNTPLFDVYVNGKELKKINRGSSDTNFDQCLELGDALKTGDNTIVMNTLGSLVPGYLFMGPTPLRDFPYMAETENQLWFDAVQFDTWLRMRSMESTLRTMRQADPNRPLELCANMDLLDETTALCERYGAFQHDTGGAAVYWCPMFGARLGITHGLPFSSEQGSPPENVADMQKAMTYYLMYGNSAVDLVFSASAYRKETAPEVGAWVDNNLELMHCIGKMDLPLPPIAILRSSRASRFGFAEPWMWDLGRGALQGIGRNFAYIEVPDITNGNINKFPVVIDDGTVLLTEKEVEGIKAYVRSGGTFVAQHHTGRHTPKKADSWPLASAFGLEVTPKYITEENFHYWPLGKIRFAPDEKLIPSLAGKEIEGCGVSVDYAGKQYTGAISIKGQADKILPIATWPDNTMAVTKVNEGEGHFILLGTPFYARMKDTNGIWLNDEARGALLDELLTSVGVSRDSWTDDRNIWAEHWVSKNGIYDLYPVARMTSKGDDEVKTLASIRREKPLTEVVEISAQGHPRIPVTWSNGRFMLPEMSYGLMQSRLFAAPRSDLQNAALNWFDVQKRHWRALSPVPPATKEEVIKMPDDILPVVADWKMTTDTRADTAWIQPGFLDADWKMVKLGSFAAMGMSEDTQARFRKKISIPEAWKGEKIQLVFDAETHDWGIGQKGQLWIDGQLANVKQPFKLYADSSFTLDVSNQAKDGNLTLALEVDGHLLDPEKKRIRPSGITGIFYLHAIPMPVATTPIVGPWLAAKDVGDFSPVELGKPAEYTYLETRFTLPSIWPAKRVFLESPVHLGWIILNGKVIKTPTYMKSLDISGLVTREGENVLRWVPATNADPYFNRVFKRTLPELNLVYKR